MRNSLKFVDPFMKFSASISGTKKLCKVGATDAGRRPQKKTHGLCTDVLDRYHRDGDKFLDRVVTGDETWVSHFTPESKRQSLEWHHPRSPSKPRKCKQTLSTRKVMATVFWDRKGVLLVEFMPQGTTINAESYCATLKRLRYAIQNWRRGVLSSGVMPLHDNARPHAAARTQAMLQESGWEVFEPQVIFTCSQNWRNFWIAMKKWRMPSRSG
jgi:hypothetical protein